MLIAVTPHKGPFDRPLADITVESRDDGVRISMMMNFQFIDAALALSGDATSVPTNEEIADVRRRLQILFKTQELALIDGVPVAPQIKDFETSPPPRPLLVREPDLARKLTQIRFCVDYQTMRPPRVVALGWRWFPEHPLYDVPNSPVAPMEVNAVVLRGDLEPDVLKLTTDASKREIRFERGDPDPPQAQGPLPPSPKWLLFAGCATLLLVIVGAMGVRRSTRTHRP